MSRDNVRRILDEQEKLNYELEFKKKKLDSWRKELNKREALTERERQKLDEDKKKVICHLLLLFKILHFTSLSNHSSYLLCSRLCICSSFVSLFLLSSGNIVWITF